MERAYSQSTAVPNFTCIEIIDEAQQQDGGHGAAPTESEEQRLLKAGGTEGATESLSALTQVEIRSSSSPRGKCIDPEV